MWHCGSTTIFNDDSTYEWLEKLVSQLDLEEFHGLDLEGLLDLEFHSLCETGE